MTDYPYRMLVGWIAALTLAWLAFSSPWQATWNLLLAAFSIALTLIAILMITRLLRTRRRAAQPVLQAIKATLDALPGDIRRNTPLVLAVGDAVGAPAKAFGEALVRITDTAIWVRVDDPTRLANVADALKRWREGQGPDAVACLVGADEVNDAGMLNAGLRRWRSAIGEASRALGYALPVCIAVYAEEANGAPDDCPWFGASGTDSLLGDAQASLVASRALQYAHAAVPADRQLRAHRAARLDALAQWATGAVLPPLLDDHRDGFRYSRPVHMAAFGVTLIAGMPAADSLLARFTEQATALTRIARGSRRALALYPLPDPLVRGVALQPVRRVFPRALAHAFAWLALAFCAACAASAWQNRALVTRILHDMARYRAIGPEHDAARIDALQAIKRDRDELNRYASAGVPPRLGLGLYRGAPLLAPLNALIAAYQPPAPPPSTIELDSLSLFRSGSAALNPGSNRVLIGALDMIKAHPDKRVLVAGHTDTTGDPGGNLRLSEARAASVRDWLADAAGLPLTHFAIQGYGDTRPKAANDTEVGRAANRRVEITLVPDCRDDHREDRKTSGYSACSFQQKE
ncbi:Peptidoglycan-associated lipoprotein [Cupriavidus laharis]|uniref:Peptidoglycan-associated lipoprotein n=1 Tax=Cupriavidus laharis TaxID=151654 RepID=A0ABM8XQ42_9BURK|nr:OmpA family protein [Cupriavidus laharis]CAG9182375.1 Peptidoglycan-associated lipoprotein [Cupriavidus laharis]